MKKLFNYLALALCLLALVFACKKKNKNNEPASSIVSIEQIIKNSTEHTILKAILEKTKFEFSAKPDGYTVFAPTDKAFQAEGIDLAFVNARDEAALTALLQYHVIADKTVFLTDVKATTEYMTLLTSKITIVKTGDKLSLTDIALQEIPLTTLGEKKSSNGVLHIISAVLSAKPFTIDGQIEKLPSNFSILKSIVTVGKISLDEIYKTVHAADDNKPFTFFAPSDAAFAKISVGVAAAEITGADKNTYTDILKYHFVKEFKLDVSSDLSVFNPTDTYLTDKKIKLSNQAGSYFVEDYQSKKPITLINKAAKSGVIHTIDEVLQAKGLSIREQIATLATSDANFSTLNAILQLGSPSFIIDLDLFLDTDAFTFFAPTNKALEELGLTLKSSIIQYKGTNFDTTDPAQVTAVKNILEYHIITEKIGSTNLVNNVDKDTYFLVSGVAKKLKVNKKNVSPSLFQVTDLAGQIVDVTTNALLANNGIIYTVATGLRFQKITIREQMERLNENPVLKGKFSTLKAILNLKNGDDFVVDLDGMVADDPFTFFAPNDDALKELGLILDNTTIQYQGTNVNNTSTAEIAAIKNILAYHIVKRKILYKKEILNDDIATYFTDVDVKKLKIKTNSSLFEVTDLAGQVVEIVYATLNSNDVLVNKGIIYLTFKGLRPTTFSIREQINERPVSSKLSTLKAILNLKNMSGAFAVDLDKMVNNDAFTFFAPNDDALKELDVILDNTTIKYQGKDVDNTSTAEIAAITDILKYHIVQNEMITSKTNIPTLTEKNTYFGGEKLKVQVTNLPGSDRIIFKVQDVARQTVGLFPEDLLANKGIIHTVVKVGLTPKILGIKENIDRLEGSFTVLKAILNLKNTSGDFAVNLDDLIDYKKTDQFTFFAPDDFALEGLDISMISGNIAFNDGTTPLATSVDADNTSHVKFLKDILAYHIVKEKFDTTTTLTTGVKLVSTYFNDGSDDVKLTVTISGDNIINLTDIAASYSYSSIINRFAHGQGIIHTAYNGLRSKPFNIRQRVSRLPSNFSTLKAILNLNNGVSFTVDLDKMVGDDSFTFFAPNNDALTGLGVAFNGTTVATNTEITAITDILKYHIVKNELITSTTSMPVFTEKDTYLTPKKLQVQVISNVVSVKDVAGKTVVVTTTDFLANKGIIHTVNTGLSAEIIKY